MDLVLTEVKTVVVLVVVVLLVEEPRHLLVGGALCFFLLAVVGEYAPKGLVGTLRTIFTHWRHLVLFLLFFFDVGQAVLLS